MTVPSHRRLTLLSNGFGAFVVCCLAGADVAAVESIHFGFNTGYATMTDSLRLSDRIGTAYWSQNRQNVNPENGQPIPYAYHDGYIEQLDVGIPTADALAQRWHGIMNGQGDSYTGASAASIGQPEIIILDELNSNFRDHLRGPMFREALRLYTAPVSLGGYGGSRNDIVAYIQPGVTSGPGVVSGLYSDVIYATNNYMRGMALELYITESGYRTGIEEPGDATVYPTGDGYLAARLSTPLRNWLNAGLNPHWALPILSISNIADVDSGGNFPEFLNRQFWFMANGRYSTTIGQVDPRIQTALRNGVGSYTWAPDVDNSGDPYQLLTTQTTRDAYFEAFLKWYSVDGNLTLHNLQLDPPLDPADFTDNGVVDADDLNLWKAWIGPHAYGDANGDNSSDGTDFLIWQRSLTAAGSATALRAVPEPASAGMMVAVVAVVASRSARMHRRASR